MSHWKSRWQEFSKQHMEWVGGAALACLLLSIFLRITVALEKSSVFNEVDLYILGEVANYRSPLATRVVLKVTDLGSPWVLTLACVLTIILLLALRRTRASVLQMIIASAGAGTWVGLGKHLIERARPHSLLSLISSSGYSYPSGHSLASAGIYLTIAFLVCRRLQEGWQRRLVIVMAIFLIGSIGFTRVYLGVHYPSDVTSGILLGMAWALFVETAFVYFVRRNILPQS